MEKVSADTSPKPGEPSNKTAILRISALAILAVALVTVFILGVPYVASCFGLTAHPTIKLFQAILSWPVAVLVLGLLFLIYYREPLSDLLRYGEVSTPWGSTKGRQPPPVEKIDRGGTEPSVGSAEYWEFMYASLFFVPHTKLVLRWFWDNSPASISGSIRRGNEVLPIKGSAKLC